MKQYSGQYNRIEKKLEQFTTRTLVASGLSRFLIFISSFSLLFFVVVTSELLFRFSSSVRTVIFFAFILITLFVLLLFIVIPLSKKYSSFKRNGFSIAAEHVGELFPTVKDQLLNALQLYKEDERITYSNELTLAAFAAMAQKVEPLDFSAVIKFDAAQKQLKLVVLGLLAAIVPILVFNGYAEAAKRFFDYSHEYLAPKPFQFIVTPGNAKITKGEDVSISIRIQPRQAWNFQPPHSVALYYKNETEAKYTVENLLADSSGTFSFLLAGVRNQTLYYCAADGVESEKFAIEVVDKPVLQSFSLKVIPPAYSKLASMQMQDNGNISTLFGSSVSLHLQASKNLAKAFLYFNDSTKINMKVAGETASVTFSAKQEKNYQIKIEDEFGNENVSPVSYGIKLQYDSSPFINVLQPNKNVDLGDDQRLPLLLSVSDDFGFSKLELHYRLSASRYEKPESNFHTIELPIAKENIEQEIHYIWNLSPLSLATEDVLTYYLEVFDNDNISGPKAAKSPSYTVRFPSLDEILAKTDKKQQDVQHDLQKTLKEADDLKKELDKVSKELKQDKKNISWEEKEKIEQTLNKFEQLQNKVDEIKKDFTENKTELQKHNLLSKETLDKYMELQKMFDEFSSDEMKKALQQLQQKLQSLDRKQIQQALENMQFDEDTFRKSIERTLNLLKRVQIEQKMDQIVKRTEEITQKQNDLQQKTEQSDLQDKNQKNDAAQQQQKLSDELQKMKNEMQQLEKLMSDMKDMPREDLQKLQEEFDAQKNDELSDEASDDIQKGEKQNAKQKQMKLSQNMQRMKQKMKQLQQQMQQQNQMETFAQLMKSLNNILSLSQDEEDAKNANQQNFQSSEMNKRAVDQDEIKNNLEKVLGQINQLAQKTFAITPEMGKALGNARNKMNNAMEGLQNRNQTQTTAAQTEAMTSLNQAALMIKNMMDQMMQGGQGGGGMMSLMQQLQQMSGQQMSLNNMTQMLQQGMSGQLTPEQQGQLQRLAQQQQLIQKSLEELNREAKESGQSKKIPTNLDETLKQMQEVITDMKSDKLSDEIIQKQERILSRLLDAQRSVNDRDYEKERESKSGINQERTSPGELTLTRQKENALKDALNNLYREGYKKDYEELIKRYFEALQKTKVKN